MKHIFLFPFAGGSSLIYNKWKFKNFDVHPVEYSGHGFRYQEALAESMEDVVGDAASQIRQVLSDGEEFVLFGHSMGGLVAWLLSQRFKPTALYVSACEPPAVFDIGRYRMYESETALMRYIKDYKRLPEKRLKSKIFLDQLLPMIKNDYRILSKYEYREAVCLDIPVKVFCSREDTLMRYEMMQKWSEYGNDVQFYELAGDHFYIEDECTRDTMIGIMEEM